MRAEGSGLSLTGALGELHPVEHLVLKSAPEVTMFKCSKLPLKMSLEDHILAVDAPDPDFPPQLEQIPFSLVGYPEVVGLDLGAALCEKL